MKEIIRGFKRGIVWCMVILTGIVVVSTIKLLAELWEEKVSHEN